MSNNDSELSYVCSTCKYFTVFLWNLTSIQSFTQFLPTLVLHKICYLWTLQFCHPFLLQFILQNPFSWCLCPLVVLTVATVTPKGTQTLLCRNTHGWLKILLQKLAIGLLFIMHSYCMKYITLMELYHRNSQHNCSAHGAQKLLWALVIPHFTSSSDFTPNVGTHDLSPVMVSPKQLLPSAWLLAESAASVEIHLLHITQHLSTDKAFNPCLQCHSKNARSNLNVSSN
jgi:hypothetical protein